MSEMDLGCLLNFFQCFFPFTFPFTFRFTCLFAFNRAHFTITHTHTHRHYNYIFSLLSVHLSVRVDYGLSASERRPEKQKKIPKDLQCHIVSVCVCLCVSRVFVKIISHYTGFNWPLMIRPSLCARLK